MASNMEPSNSEAPTHNGMTSLAELAQRKIFRELAKYIRDETKHSTFAVGGSIPITLLADHLICESDDTASESDDAPGQQLSKDTGSGQDSKTTEAPTHQDNAHPTVSYDLSDTAPHREALGARGEELVSGSGIQNNIQTSESESTSHRMRCDPVTIRWDSAAGDRSAYKVTLPCPNDQRPLFEQLLKDCQPASFGLGGKDVMDETYRKAGKLDETAFCTNFNPYALGIIDTAAQALVPNNSRQKNETHGLRAELYKLNVYAAPSGKFKPHVDTPRSKHQVGSLVICLPNVHEGGQLVLRHRGRETVFDWSGEKGATAIQWAAFYSDCEHEVLDVTAGERVTLTYNLYATCSANAALIDVEQTELYRTMKVLLEQPGFCKNGATIGYHCVHAYPHTSKDTISTFPATLKGADKVVHACFAATNHPVRLRHVLGMNRVDMEWDDAYLRLLETTAESDLPKLEALQEYYYRVPDEVKNERTKSSSHYRWLRKDDPNHKKIDVAVLADNLVPLHYTRTGFFEEGTEDIIRAWTREFSIEKVKWLNNPTHQELALVHGAYGNEPSMGRKYARLAVILEIPPSQAR